MLVKIELGVFGYGAQSSMAVCKMWGVHSGLAWLERGSWERSYAGIKGQKGTARTETSKTCIAMASARSKREYSGITLDSLTSQRRKADGRLDCANLY